MPEALPRNTKTAPSCIWPALYMLAPTITSLKASPLTLPAARLKPKFPRAWLPSSRVVAVEGLALPIPVGLP